MDNQTLFWLLVGIGVLLAIAIFGAAGAIRAILSNELFMKDLEKKRKREQEAEEKRKHGNTPAKTLLVLLGLCAPGLTMAAGVDDTSEPVIRISNSVLWGIAIADSLLALVLMYYLNLLKGFVNVARTDAELEKARSKKKRRFRRILTAAVPIEEEVDILMDHEYDGIRELDNKLPPWWKYGFYLSIVVAVIYMFHYHVAESGDLQIAEYEQEMVLAEAEVRQYLADKAMNVDEYSVTTMLDPSQLASGGAIFDQYCVVCHGGGGEGLVGPNLTDDYWLYGGRINDVFKTIKYGAERGMKSWKDELNPIQMQEVASYIKSLRGTNPPNPKDPEGDLESEESIGDRSLTDSIPSGTTTQQ